MGHPAPVPTWSPPRPGAGAIIGSSFRLIGLGFGPIIIVGLVSSVITTGLAVALLIWGWPRFLLAFMSANLTNALVELTSAATVAVFVSWLIQAHAGLAVTKITCEVAEGRKLGVLAAIRGTRGLLSRVLVTYLLAAAALLIILGGTLAWFQHALDESVRTEDPEALVGFFGWALLLWVASAIPGWLLSVRWFCFLPVAGLEKLNGIAALRRSWQVTSGYGGTIFLSLLLANTVPFLLRVVAAPVLLVSTVERLTGFSGGLLDMAQKTVGPIAIVVVIDGLLQVLVRPFRNVVATVVHHTKTTPVPARTAGVALPAGVRPVGPPPGFGPPWPGGYPPAQGLPQPAPGVPTSGYPPMGLPPGHPAGYPPQPGPGVSAGHPPAGPQPGGQPPGAGPGCPPPPMTQPPPMSYTS